MPQVIGLDGVRRRFHVGALPVPPEPHWGNMGSAIGPDGRNTGQDRLGQKSVYLALGNGWHGLFLRNMANRPGIQDGPGPRYFIVAPFKDGANALDRNRNIAPDSGGIRLV